MTNFETGTRNTLLWRVPGQRKSSQGRNERIVESVDLFPTLVELAGLPPLPACTGRDQPPTVACVQGESYASEFVGSAESAAEPKAYAFSQWPYPAWPPVAPYLSGTRMGYTVRSASGIRLTEYVPYDLSTAVGDWDEDPYAEAAVAVVLAVVWLLVVWCGVVGF